MYLKEVKLRAAELAHKSTWSLKEKIKKTEHKIRISENKINDLKESFAARYLAGLVRKLEKSKKNSKAIADAQKLHAEQQKALTEAKKLKAVAQEKKHELKQDLKYRKYLLKKDLKNKHISKTDYSINKSKLVDSYHEDVIVLNKKIKD